MKNIVLTFGILCGILLSIYVVISGMMVSPEMDLSTSTNIGYAAIFLAVGIPVYLATKKIRDEQNNGSITYGKVVTRGLLIALIGAVIYALSWTVYSELSDKDFLKIYTELAIKEMHEDGSSDEEIELAITLMEKMEFLYNNLFYRFVISILEPLPEGILTTLFIGLIVRKKGKKGEISETT